MNPLNWISGVSPFFIAQNKMPTLKQTIRRVLEATGIVEKAAGVPSGLGGADPFAIWRNGNKKISPEKAMDVYAGWVYACVRAIAEELANMQLKMMEVQSDNTSEELPEHDLLDLLEAPNPYMTGRELKYSLASHLELTGNAYLYLFGVKNAADIPTAIYVLNPKYVKINRGKFPDLITSYEYRVGSELNTYQPYEIIHLKYPDPNDPLEGIGTVQAIAQWIDADNYATEFNRRFFLNGARIGGYLESAKAVTPEQLEYLKKSFEQIYSGVENAYRTAALPAGTTFKEASANQKEMDFVEGQRLMRDKILAGFRVPKTALGLTEDVNRANAEATDYVFASRTILPKMRMITAYLNEFLVPRYGDKLWMDIVNPVPEDRIAKVQEMQAVMGQQPLLSLDEGREMYLSKGPVAGGDMVRGDFSKQPIGAPLKSASKPSIKTAGKKRIKSRFAKNVENRKGIASAIAKEVAEAAKEFTKQHKAMVKKARKDITTLSDDEYDVLHKAFVTRLTPYEKMLADKIKAHNDEQRSEVLDNVGKLLKAFKGKKKAVNPDDLFDEEKAITALIDLATPVLTDLFEKEGEAAASLIGFSEFTALTDQVKEAIDHAVGLLSDSYTQTTRQLLKEKLTEAMREGPDIDILKEKVNEIYDYGNEVRAEMVARSETFRIGNQATLEAWKQSGVVQSKKWYTAADERVCPYCAPMHGKVIGINETFFSKGDSVEGSDGSTLDLHYDDIEGGNLHVNCRCYIRPEDISLEEKVQPAPATKEQEQPEEADDAEEKEIEDFINELQSDEQKNRTT